LFTGTTSLDRGNDEQMETQNDMKVKHFVESFLVGAHARDA